MSNFGRNDMQLIKKKSVINQFHEMNDLETFFFTIISHVFHASSLQARVL